MKIATANQIQITPNGSKAVMVVTHKVVKNENDYYYTRNLYMTDLVSKNDITQLTFGDKNDGQPQWSPDGKQITFVRSDGDKLQIWLLPLTEARPDLLPNENMGQPGRDGHRTGRLFYFHRIFPYMPLRVQFHGPMNDPEEPMVMNRITKILNRKSVRKLKAVWMETLKK